MVQLHTMSVPPRLREQYLKGNENINIILQQDHKEILEKNIFSWNDLAIGPRNSMQLVLSTQVMCKIESVNIHHQWRSVHDALILFRTQLRVVEVLVLNFSKVQVLISCLCTNNYHPYSCTNTNHTQLVSRKRRRNK